jgi:Tfp pilus assembly protein PilF
VNPVIWTRGRRLVPRWRSLGSTLASLELASPRKAGVSAEPISNVDYLARLERWTLHPSLVTAAELLEIAIIDGREKDALNAARRLVQIDKNATPLIHAQAIAVLRRNGLDNEIPVRLLDTAPAPAARHFTRLHPKDPLAWVELALRQVVAGHSPAARHSMRIALALAPNDRHVLRSAARLYLHDGEPERAHDLIARNAATKGDPWLMAAEIALAEVAKRDPRFQKLGLRTLDDRNLSARQITELAGSVGTEEFLNGSRKKSRRSFELSMNDPTGSSLAQGEWASQEIGSELVSDARLQTTLEAAEAQAFHRHRLGAYEDVPELCWKWADADSFSIRPFEFGSAIAGMLQDHEAALKLAEKGLAMRPGTPGLLNAMAFSLASSGEPERAAEQLIKINLNESDYVYFLTAANWGLVAFRSGYPARGRELYNRAVEGFNKLGRADLAARAKIYLAVEAIRAQEVDGPALLAEATKAAVAVKHDENAFILERLAATLGGDDVPKHTPSANLSPRRVVATFPPGRGEAFLIDIMKK